MFVWHEPAYLASAAACAGVATVTDCRSRRIPNRLTGSAIVAGLALHLSCGGLLEAGSSLLSGLVAGSVFLLFFLAGGMGAGDVKLITAVGCLAGLHPLPPILLITAFTGAVAAVIIALVRGRLRETASNVREIFAHHQSNGLTRHPDLHVANQSLLRLPYAFSVASGCVATLLLSFYGGIAR